jgi:hypothetical protein
MQDYLVNAKILESLASIAQFAKSCNHNTVSTFELPSLGGTKEYFHK